MRPLPVCHLHARREGAELHLSWVRRSHLGWAWNDGVAVPPDSFPERYRLTLVGPSAQLECETDTAGVVLDVSSLPAEPGQTLEIRVQTIGPMALSRARIIRITM